MKSKLTDRNSIVQGLINLVPKGFRLRFNPDRYAIEKSLEKFSKSIKRDSLILDAGAGPSPYKSFFKHCKFEATDFNDTFKNLDFTCSLDNIPKKNNHYDIIISTEVLEHVPYPDKVIKEFHRVLKNNGRLYFTVPQGRTIHQEPYNFFNFTKYGLQILLKDAGFKKFKIRPKGGYFWFLADVIRFNGILSQIKSPIIRIPLKIIEYPFTNILIPFILFHLDFLDREKKWTCGYLVVAKKEPTH